MVVIQVRGYYPGPPVRRATILATISLAFIQSVSAETIVLACEFEGSERTGPEREKEINQVIVDTTVPAIDLRISQTMGTTEEVNFLFSSNDQGTGDRLVLTTNGSKIAAAGIRAGVATSFALDLVSGAFVWAWAEESGSRAYRYHCRK